MLTAVRVHVHTCWMAFLFAFRQLISHRRDAPTIFHCLFLSAGSRLVRPINTSSVNYAFRCKDTDTAGIWSTIFWNSIMMIRFAFDSDIVWTYVRIRFVRFHSVIRFLYYDISIIYIVKFRFILLNRIP